MSSIKTILVPIDGSESSRPVLAAAGLLARSLGAHLEALHIRAGAKDFMPYVNLSAKMSKVIEAQAAEDSAERATAVHHDFEEFCAETGLNVADSPATPRPSASWREERGRVSERLVERARLFDLCVVARPARAAGAIRRSPVGENLEALLLESGRPILMVPPGNHATIGNDIVIGWNDSAESARAVAAATDWLEQARSVTILASRGREEQARALGENLAWHDVKAEVRVFEAGSRSVGEVLLAEVTELKADLLIIGGYSHARARQLLLGGVTRHVIGHASIPVMLAH